MQTFYIPDLVLISLIYSLQIVKIMEAIIINILIESTFI